MDEVTKSEIAKLSKSLASPLETEQEELLEIIATLGKDLVKSAYNDMDDSQKKFFLNVLEKAKKSRCWEDYKPVKGKKPFAPGSCEPVKKACDCKDEGCKCEEVAKSFDLSGEVLEKSEYQGRKVTLNKPMSGDSKKYKVYVKNDKGNVVKVEFGDPNMEIKRDNPERRANFRARHNCADKTDKTSAGYWSCKMWSKTPVSEMTKSENVITNEEQIMEKSYEGCMGTMKSYMNKGLSKSECMEKMMGEGYEKSMCEKAYGECAKGMEKAKALDDVAFPEADALKEKVMLSKEDKRKEQDEVDEKMVKPENAEQNHQGTPTEGWSGQVIKSELSEAAGTLRLAKSMGFTKEAIKASVVESNGDFSLVKAALENTLYKSFASEEIDEEELEGVFKSLNEHPGMILDYFNTNDNDFACDLLLAKAKTVTRAGMQYYADGKNAGKLVGSIRGDGASAKSIARARKKGKVSAEGAKEGIKEANQNKKDADKTQAAREKHGARMYFKEYDQGTGDGPYNVQGSWADKKGASLKDIKRAAAKKLASKKAGLDSKEYKDKQEKHVQSQAERSAPVREAREKLQYNKDGSPKKTKAAQAAMKDFNEKKSKRNEDRSKAEIEFDKERKATKQAGDAKEKELRAKQDARDSKKPMEKSVPWEDANRLLKANTLGRNTTYSVDETIAKSYEPAPEEEVLAKSENPNDINEIIAKGQDIDAIRYEELAKGRKIEPKGAYTVESFDLQHLSDVMGISIDKAKEILGVE